MDEYEETARDEADFGERKGPGGEPEKPGQDKGKNSRKPMLMALGGIVIATVSFLLGRISSEYNK